MASIRILIVEDEMITALDLKERLEAMGYSVVGQTGAGEDAVRLAAEIGPDLVLMDIRLDGTLDGVAAADAIRSSCAIPIVYLTAHADFDTLLRARTTEPFGYVIKPFEERALQASIETAVYKHQAECKLRASERRYAVTLASIREAVISTDSGGRVAFFNPAAERLTGWPQAEAVGRRVDEVVQLVSEATGETVENPADRALREVVPVNLANGTALVDRNSKRVPIADGAAPILDQGQLLGSVLVLHDLTEYRRIETELRQTQRMEALGRLAGGVAHDFNNMLTVINGYCLFLLRDLDSAHPWHEMIGEINNAGERAANLTRQLLAFCRKQILQPRPLDLNQTVSNLAPMLNRLIGEHFETRISLDPAVGSVWADPGQIEQVILNLVLNARDAMPDGGRLTLATAHVLIRGESKNGSELPPGSYEQLIVSDTGCGMESTVQARIFEPFFTTKESGKGTGLGLATVYGIVKQSDGHIAVTSEVGAGSTFTISFPTRKSNTERDPSSPRLPLELIPGSGRILLVEDEGVTRMFTRKVLEAAGYQVLEARHGEEAIQLFNGTPERFDLVLTDVFLPHMQGPELVRRLRSQRPRLKVLFVTGYAEFPGQIGSDENTAIMTKPFKPAELTQVVHVLLGRRG
jgi:two-component system, cell cycle sensor histidine kinase and response regulator CckA